ncbi:MAG: VWA domain-containing protein [Roseovarius sp.]|nr:VWA domain-containing protein [Roseovarius sp.]
MPEYPDLELPENPKLTHNITHFARALRKTGLPAGLGRVLDAIRAVEAAGFVSKSDFFYTLRSCFINRPEHRAVFAQVFRLYWRDPRFMEHMMALLLPTMRGVQEERKANPSEKRAAEALLHGVERDAPEANSGESGEDVKIDIDASMTMSSEERLKTLDFEQMGTDEIARAKRMLSRLSLPVKPLASRRGRPSSKGHVVDSRRTLRAAMRRAGEIREIHLKKPRPLWPNLVVLCDISGSMSQYSRMILHFLHSVANHRGDGWARVHAFTFGTRLTNITRHLATRDVDEALAAAGREARDWEGGTRIGSCLREFNRDWSRRVMGQGAVVLLVTDGLDRGNSDMLGRETERIRLSSRKLIWINPLLRWDGFAPKAEGIRAILPNVDVFQAGHSIASLEELAEAISNSEGAGEKSRLMAAL